MTARICLILIICLLGSTSTHAALEDVDPKYTEAWQSRLKDHFFPQQNLLDGHALITVDIPARAEDGAMVPVRITSLMEQTPEHYIKEMWLIIDNNPSPLAGHFKLSANSGKADMELRIRVDAYSPVRLIAQTNDDKLYMTAHFVKASGGCSAPAGTDLQTAMEKLGKMRIKTRLSESLLNPVATTLAISHPNISGLQKDQVTTLFIPPHYIRSVQVDFAGEPVFSAETDISISENPVFHFYFVPGQEGILKATVTDTEGNVFVSEEKLTSPTELN
ncbi:MAG: quinoprotein dehydrogenase-associated SoxYZ-like carrier [Thiolinea sp.]